MQKTVNILGTEYTIEFNFESKEADGEARVYEKIMRIRPVDDMLDEAGTIQSKTLRQKEVIRHECFHSILFEAGANEYASDEKLVDMLAILSPKIFKIFQELDAL